MGYTSMTDFIRNMLFSVKERSGNSDINEIIGDSVLTAEKKID